MPKRPASSPDIVIVGNGLAGQVMALTLAAQQIPSVLIGPLSNDHDDGRTTAIMQDGVDDLTALGVWDPAVLQPVALRNMHLISGDRDIIFAAADIGLAQFGFNVANAQLKRHGQKHLAASPLITTVHATVTRIETNDAGMPHIVCDNGQTIPARLIIAADGRRSVVREFAGIAVATTTLDQQALVCVVQSDQQHHETSTEWYHRGGPFTLVPMPSVEDRHHMAVVYCDTAATIGQLMAETPLALGDYFTAISQGLFGDLTVINTPQSWPVLPQRAQALVAPHVALIGEAAHVMPPLAAQGFNTSLRDIRALCAVIVDALHLGLDIGHVATLQPYARARRMDVHLRATSVDMLNTIIRQDDVIGRKAHGLAFRALDRIAPLKRLLMRQALAPRDRRRA